MLGLVGRHELDSFLDDLDGHLRELNRNTFDKIESVDRPAGFVTLAGLSFKKRKLFMAKYHFMGGTTNLGRHGELKRGDVLELTEKEEQQILSSGPGGGRDPRFLPYKDGAKISGAGLDLPLGFETMAKERQASEIKIAEDAKAKAPTLSPQDQSVENARLENLSNANNNSNVENYREMTKPELLEVAEALKRDGAKLEINDKSSRNVILRAVLAAKSLSAEGVEGE